MAIVNGVRAAKKARPCSESSGQGPSAGRRLLARTPRLRGRGPGLRPHTCVSVFNVSPSRMSLWFQQEGRLLMEKKILGSQSLGLLGGVSRPQNRLLEASVSLRTLKLFSTRNGVATTTLSVCVFARVSVGGETTVPFLLPATAEASVPSSASSLPASRDEVSHGRCRLPSPATPPSGAALRTRPLLALSSLPFAN